MASLRRLLDKISQVSSNEKGSEIISEESIESIRKELQVLKAGDLDVFKVLKKNWVYRGERYNVACKVVEKKTNYVVCVFFLRPRARIPLHDHPSMHGFLKVLCGSLEIVGYNQSPYNKEAASNGCIPSSGFTHCRGPVITLSSQDNPCVLTPVHGNIHELKALNEPVAILDVLVPPYDEDKERDCHYYCVAEESQDGKWVRMKEVPDDYYGFTCIPVDYIK